jgi:branched-chain amino acid transport system ATP-binding protein
MLGEPFLGLSPLFVATIFDIIGRINASGTVILLIEQNVHNSLKIYYRGNVLENSRVALAGTGEKLLEDPISARPIWGCNKRFYVLSIRFYVKN